MNSSICMYFTFFNLGQNSFYVGTTYRMNNIRKASYQSYSSPETHRCSGSRRTKKTRLHFQPLGVYHEIKGSSLYFFFCLSQHGQHWLYSNLFLHGKEKMARSPSLRYRSICVTTLLDCLDKLISIKLKVRVPKFKKKLL